MEDVYIFQYDVFQMHTKSKTFVKGQVEGYTWENHITVGSFYTVGL